MKRLGTFQSKRWGTVVVSQAHYLFANGPICIHLDTADGEPLTKLSVNMYRPECSHDSADLPADCFYVKQWSENETLAEEAMASGLFRARPDLGVATSGFVETPVWQVVTDGAAS